MNHNQLDGMDMTEDKDDNASGDVQNPPKANAHLERLFAFIVTEIKEQGAAPSYEQICNSLGYSKGLVSRRIRQLHDQGRIIIDGDRKSMTLRIAKGQGHDDIAELPDMTSDRKAILTYVQKYMNRNGGRGPSVHAIGKALGFSNNKARRHVDYLDEAEKVRYSPHLNEVIVINQGDYVKISQLNDELPHPAEDKP